MYEGRKQGRKERCWSTAATAIQGTDPLATSYAHHLPVIKTVVFISDPLIYMLEANMAKRYRSWNVRRKNELRKR